MVTPKMSKHVICPLKKTLNRVASCFRPDTNEVLPELRREVHPVHRAPCRGG